MATLIPDHSRLIYSETAVTPPMGHSPHDAYDLHLYMEPGSNSRGVLVVGVTLQLQFVDGISMLPATRGQSLHWTEAEKRAFANQFKASLYKIWNDKYRITTTSTVPVVRDVGVEFDIGVIIDGWNTDGHWELVVEKADDFRESSVTPSTGDSDLDIRDIVPVVRTLRYAQRGAVHEFGHMLGLRDEYPTARDNPYWTVDFASVMNSGEMVRERHYAMFAAWITEQYAYAAHLARESIRFKVNGRVDLSNAML